MTIIDQFESNCTVSEAMNQFAETHFGEPRKVALRSIRPDGDGVVFHLASGVRLYRIKNVNRIWQITLEEPTT